MEIEISKIKLKEILKDYFKQEISISYENFDINDEIIVKLNVQDIILKLDTDEIKKIILKYDEKIKIYTDDEDDNISITITNKK